MDCAGIPIIRAAVDAQRAAGTRADDDRPTLGVIAFEGWNDAGEAATDALELLRETWGVRQIAEIDDEQYYDFQFTRPQVRRVGGESRIDWPRTRIYSGTLPEADCDVVMVSGMEPSFKWRAFSALLEEYLSGADAIILLGALLADVPHSRPLPVSVTSEDAALRHELDLERSSYEGPTGVLGVLENQLGLARIPVVSAWVAVPNYVAQSPSPKAQLALLGRMEELTGITIPYGDLHEDAQAWETGVDELAQHDAEIADYVARLEQMRDATDLPEASGEAIAQEFERFLRRRPPGDKGSPSS
ncbi:proteasome assembly chaperone family protein [Sediminivirga luteola]|uniref:proteasome assembly chaperone family protein n=1 Tax=Sediminivirga luteola TaxID=1774748 RepID=UPI001F56E398|nr:PAC2 family protein [Sediminivirga luteola]MCI2263919.1 PAC2 family protein [Sediminivirga luteola]